MNPTESRSLTTILHRQRAGFGMTSKGGGERNEQQVPHTTKRRSVRDDTLNNRGARMKGNSRSLAAVRQGYGAASALGKHHSHVI